MVGWSSATEPQPRFELPVVDVSRTEVHQVVSRMMKLRAVNGQEGMLEGHPSIEPWLTLQGRGYIQVAKACGFADTAYVRMTSLALQHVTTGVVYNAAAPVFDVRRELALADLTHYELGYLLQEGLDMAAVPSQD